MQTKIWALTDNKTGHKSQIEGVLTLLEGSKRLFTLNNSWLGKLNFSFWPLGVKLKALLKFKRLIKQKDIPDLIMAIGRRNLSIALYLKKQLLPLNPKVKLVFLMPPGSFTPKIDLIFMHRYKMNQRKDYGKHVLAIDFSPTKIIEKPTAEIKDSFYHIFNALPKPHIGVIIGGVAKGVHWNKKSAKKFAGALKNLVAKNGGSLLITTSRRTGKRIIGLLKQELLSTSNFFWNFNDHNKVNPYNDILLNANYLVVTGESTSMIAETVSLPNNSPVLIYDDSKFISERFKKFHEFLYNNHYAASLEEGKIILNNKLPSKKTENSAVYITKSILKLVKEDTI